MQNELIKKDKFEEEKNKIKQLSLNTPKPICLDNFPTKGSIFSWNSHNITGEEANDKLVKPLQDTIIKQNDSIKSLYDIATSVYNTFDQLDKEYIAGIVSAVYAAEEASNQAKEASSKAEQASDKALKAQEDINRTIKALQQTVGILQEFKKDTEARRQSIKQELELEKNLQFDKKLKIAYAIASGSVLFSLVQLILQLLGIL